MKTDPIRCVDCDKVIGIGDINCYNCVRQSDDLVDIWFICPKCQIKDGTLTLVGAKIRIDCYTIALKEDKNWSPNELKYTTLEDLL